MAGKKRKSRKHRTAAQKAATAKMLAANKSRRGGHKKRESRKHRHVASNPVRHVYHKAKKHHRKHRRAKKNPLSLPRMGGIGTQINDTLIPAVVGTIGATALDIGYAYLPLPANLKTGKLRYLVKAGVAIGFGFVAGKLIGRQRGEMAGVGMLTSIGTDMAKELVASTFPNIRMDSVHTQAPVVTQAAITGATAATPAGVKGLNYFTASQVVDGMDGYIDGADDWDQGSDDRFSDESMSGYVDGMSGHGHGGSYMGSDE